MEATLIIKMPDGTTKTLELTNANINMNLSGLMSFPNDLNIEPNFLALQLTAQIKASSLTQLF